MQSLGPLLASCVMLGKTLDFSVPQFLNLYKMLVVVIVPTSQDSCEEQQV
jgi:hypothetical protein